MGNLDNNLTLNINNFTVLTTGIVITGDYIIFVLFVCLFVIVDGSAVDYCQVVRFVIVDGSAVDYCQVVRFVCLSVCPSVCLSVCPDNFVTAITS